MVTRVKGRFINRPTKTERGTYDKFFIYVPTELARDSSFPLKHAQEVEIRIDQENRVLVIQHIEGRKTGKRFSKD